MHTHRNARLTSVLTGLGAFGLALLVGCGSMQQQKPPSDATDDLETGAMDIGDAAPKPPAEEPALDAEPAEPEVDLATKCCRECVAAVKKDESGDPPGALNCATLPEVASACILHFNENPTTGKEAMACAGDDAEAGEGDADAAADADGG